MHDLRHDQEMAVTIPDDAVARRIEDIMAYKGYVVERPAVTDYLQLNGLKDYGITVSIGVAEFDPDQMATPNDLLRAADADMYERKGDALDSKKAG